MRSKGFVRERPKSQLSAADVLCMQTSTIKEHFEFMPNKWLAGHWGFVAHADLPPVLIVLLPAQGGGLFEIRVGARGQQTSDLKPRESFTLGGIASAAARLL